MTHKKADNIHSESFSDPCEKTGNAALRRRWQMVAGVFGLLTCWMFRFLLNGDTFAQFELANSVARGDWSIVPNGHWSPLFPFFLGSFLKVLHPNAFWEYPVYHLACGAVYLLLLAAFDFFLNQLIDHHELGLKRDSSEAHAVPRWVWYVIGYPAFIFMSVVWIMTYYSGSDLAATLFVFWMAGLILKIDRDGFSLQRSLALGVAIGFGFLAKAIFVYVGGFFLAALLLRRIRGRDVWISLAGIVLMAALVAAPWVAWLSHSKGRFTLSDVGAETYMNSTLGAVLPTFGAGETIDRTQLKHPPRKLMSHPDVYEFATPLRATYPLWYDSTYWLEGGIHPQFSIRAQASILVIWITYTLYLLFAKGFPGVILVFIFGFLVIVLGRSWRRAFKNTWFLLIPSAGVVLLYAMVHSQARYLVPFFLIVWLCFWRVYFENSKEESVKIGKILAVSAALVLMLNTVFVLASESRKVREPLASGGSHWNVTGRLSQLFEGSSSNFNHVFWRIAQAAKASGLQEGDRIALLGTQANAPMWAHLARVKIVAEIPERSVQEFNTLELRRRGELLEKFRQLDIRAMVALEASLPQGEGAKEWQRIGTSQYWMQLIQSKNEGGVSV